MVKASPKAAASVGHNKGPVMDLEVPFANDSLTILARKLKETEAQLGRVKEEKSRREILVGNICLAARSRFGIPRELTAAQSQAYRDEFSQFREWCYHHSGLSYKTVGDYMRLAKNPNLLTAVDARKRQKAREDRGWSPRGSVESRVKQAVSRVLALPDDQIDNALSRIMSALEARRAASPAHPEVRARLQQVSRA